MPIGRAVLVLATAGALALFARAVVLGPPPLWVPLLVLAAYLVLVVLGVVFPRFGMFADVVSCGPRGSRGVALTFDDGPDPATTPAILRALERAGARATFFVVGRKAEQHETLVAAMARAGHGVELHGYAHDRLFALRSAARVRRDLRRGLEVIERITGARPTMLRAPVGPVSPTIARVAKELGLRLVGWSVKGLDGWSGGTAQLVLARVLPRLRDGCVVLLHDASERGDFEPASLAALPEILRTAAHRELPLVLVSGWLAADR